MVAAVMAAMMAAVKMTVLGMAVVGYEALQPASEVVLQAVVPC
jgi:hypothetical protein